MRRNGRWRTTVTLLTRSHVIHDRIRLIKPNFKSRYLVQQFVVLHIGNVVDFCNAIYLSPRRFYTSLPLLCINASCRSS